MFEDKKAPLENTLREKNSEEIRVKAERLLNFCTAVESHVKDQIKIAVSDFMSWKTSHIRSFDDLQISLLNIHEILHHPLLSDELRDYGVTVLAGLIESLIREEGALRGLDFVSRNIEYLDPKVIREVLPELTNPFLVVGDKIISTVTEKFVKELEDLLGLFLEGEGYRIRRLAREKIESYAGFLREQSKQKTKHNIPFIIVILIFLLIASVSLWLFF